MKKLSQFKGAWPFFAAVFLNAFVDLGHKITVQNTIFKLYGEQSQIIATAILNAMILLPFILLLSPAGFLSDKFKRVSVMRASAWLVVILSALITVAYHLGWFHIAFMITFLLAAQSAIYSPAKFAFIKEMFGKTRLGEANGVVAALSIVAILGGTFAFTIAFELMYGEGLTSEAEVLQAIAPIGFMLVATAVFELVMMYRIPLENEFSEPSNADAKFEWSRFFSGRLFARDLEPFTRSRTIRLSVIGLSTFWGIGQVMLAAFPAFFKTETGTTNAIAVQGILACSGIGIALGSFIAGRVSRDHIELGLLPIASIGIAVGLLILPGLSNPYFAALDFLFIGCMGGMFIVPLNALIQFNARSGQIGKTLAANNWVQNVTMFSFLVLTASFAFFELSSKSLLQLISLVAVLGCGYTLYQLPQSFVRFLLIFVMRRHYRVRVQGMKNIPAQGGALLLGNHVSWIDWAIIQLASPRPIRFVMIRNIYERWYLKWFFDLFGCIPIEQGPRSRESLKNIAQLLEQGELVCLFPEGTLSRTGHLVEFRKGYELACEELSTEVPIIPFYLHGLWGSQFSRSTSLLKQSYRLGAKRDLVIAFGAPQENSISADVLKRRLFELSVSSWQHYVDSFDGIAHKWVHAAKQQGRKFCMADSTGVKLNGVQALTATTALKMSLAPKLKSHNVGVILPSAAGGALANLALLQAGHCIVNLNYTAGRDALQAAMERAEIETVVTSSKFLKKLKGKGIDVESIVDGKHLILLEEIKSEMGLGTKLVAALLCRLLPARLLKYCVAANAKGDDIAAILFSSGSEGTPKGVCLSHKNIMANVKQTLTVLNPDEDDLVMGNLPFFHAFGLTVTQFLPLLEGVPVVYNPDPTDALGSSKLVARHRATIMFGTSTFLRLYTANKRIHSLMLQSLKLVVSGAEKLNQQVRKEFKEKFNVNIYEGYGATEATPVVSVNLPDKLGLQDFKVQLGAREGSVGMPLPGTSIRIVDPQTHEELNTGEAGMVLIGGVQVMQGYLKDPEKTSSVIVNIDGQRWYVTGDKGYIDADGFLFIVDRYSRFAKIGGEMLSLGKIEQVLCDAYEEKYGSEQANELELVVVNLPDEKRGERLVLLSNTELDEFLNADCFAGGGLGNLAIPSQSVVLEDVPKLASGKMDFGTAKKIASES
jgi:acyl-[acyl-carrier-protein]-phospholipid O-acyltransferase/long-chain-fatty-acid--[acyl-carrier-protein] ligase